MMRFNIGFKRWRHRKPYFVLLTLELLLTILILVLFGIAEPNTYRTRLWEDGSRNGFNSAPSQPIFDLVNGKEMHVPLVWSETMTKFNLILSILTIFLWLVKTIFFTINWLKPFLSLIVNALQLALTAYSVHLQAAPDTIDPKHSNPGLAWYITKSCNVAALRSNVGFCQQAKASFIATIVMIALYSGFLIVTLQSVFFSPEKASDLEGFGDHKNKFVDDGRWEMVPIPETPGTAYGGHFPPTTPRTTAFNALEGGGRQKPMFPPPPKKARKK